MRFIFHAMLGFSVGVVATGIVGGTVVRDRAGHRGTHADAVHARDFESRLPIERTVAPPLPVLPRYGDPVAPGARLAWHLLEGTDGALVEISSTPTFEPGSTQQLEADGETVKLPAGLGAGIWYWRLRGRQGDVIGETATSTWMVDVVVPESEPSWG